MKQFKHTITGFIATETTDSIGKEAIYEIDKSIDTNPLCLPANFIENSKDWEEIKEPLYTMLSLKCKKILIGTSVSQGDIVECRLSTNGKIEWRNGNGWDVYSNTEWQKSLFTTFNIYSIRRESDGEIFTIGDKIGLNNEKKDLLFTITSFFIEPHTGICMKCNPSENEAQRDWASLTSYIKIKPKEWEILEYISKTKNCIVGPKSDLLENGAWDINTVMYIPTKEVFEIGSHTSKGLITKIESIGSAPNQDIWIHTTIGMVTCAWTLGKGIKLQSKKESEIEWRAKNAQRLAQMHKDSMEMRIRAFHEKAQNYKRKPLFITEDGKSIFLDDPFWVAHDNKFGVSYMQWTVNPRCIYARDLVYDIAASKKYGNIYFYSKESAEEYILMNKPCLSINDLISIDAQFPKGKDGIHLTFGGLRNLVRSKIK